MISAECRGKQKGRESESPATAGGLDETGGDTPQETMAKLRQAEIELNQVATIEAVAGKLEISEQASSLAHLYGGGEGAGDWRG